jgi:hypothetical protein
MPAFLAHFEACLEQLTVWVGGAPSRWCLNPGPGPSGKKGRALRVDAPLGAPTLSGAAVVAIGACSHPENLAAPLSRALVVALGNYLVHPACWRVERDKASGAYLLQFDPGLAADADPRPSPLVSYGTLLHTSPAFQAWDYLVRGALPSLNHLLYHTYAYLRAALVDDVTWPEWERLRDGQQWLPAPLTPSNPVVATCSLAVRAADQREPKLKAAVHVAFINVVAAKVAERLTEALQSRLGSPSWSVSVLPAVLEGRGKGICGGVLELRLASRGSMGEGAPALKHLTDSGALDRFRVQAPAPSTVQVCQGCAWWARCLLACTGLLGPAVAWSPRCSCRCMCPANHCPLRSRVRWMGRTASSICPPAALPCSRALGACATL